MPKRIIFKLDDEKFIVNVGKGLLVVKNTQKYTKEMYFLDNLNFGDDWIVMEATLSRKDAIIWEFEDIEIEFLYAKDK